MNEDFMPKEKNTFGWIYSGTCKRIYLPADALRQLFGEALEDEEEELYLRVGANGNRLAIVRSDGAHPRAIKVHRKGSTIAAARVFDYCVRVTGLKPRRGWHPRAPMRFEGRVIFVDLGEAY